MLRDLRSYTNYFLLVFDNEDRATELIEELQRAGVVEGVGAEQRKAFLSQLANAAKQIDDEDARRAAMSDARDRAANMHEKPGVAPEFVLWRENFEANNFTELELCDVINTLIPEAIAVDLASLEAARKDRPDAGIATVLVDLVKSRGHEVGKPEFGRALARYALDNPDYAGDARPLLVLAEHLVQLSGADRRLSGRLRD